MTGYTAKCKQWWKTTRKEPNWFDLFVSIYFNAIGHKGEMKIRVHRNALFCSEAVRKVLFGFFTFNLIFPNFFLKFDLI